MKKLIFLLTILGLFAACTSDNSGNGGGNDDGGGGGLIPQATYRITFTGEFTSNSHPQDYPANPMFSGMVLIAHSNTTTVFRNGQLASAGLEEYVEDGSSTNLVQEHTQTEEGINPTVILVGNDIGPTGVDVINMTITPSTTRFSFVSKIGPSPDWFVGIDAFDFVLPDNTLVEDITIKLFPRDAGTDSGTTYTSDDMDDDGTISDIAGFPFVDDSGGINQINRLGTVRLERID